jgi:glycosyltransferase involved in cell wall biosynthesis
VKALVLTWSRLSGYGGIQTVVQSLAAALDYRGVVSVARMLPTDSDFHQRGGGAKGRLQKFGFKESLTEAIANHRFDLIHSHNIQLPHCQGIPEMVQDCADEAGIPHVATVHDVDTGVGRSDVLKKCTSVATSIYNAVVLQALYGVRPFVIPPCVDFSRITPLARTFETRTIAYPGRLTRGKGALNAVQKLSRLPKPPGPVKIVFSNRDSQASWGDETFLAELDQTLQQHGLQHEFLEGPNGVESMFGRAALTLCIPQRVEGFGLAALESIACGCPVVAAPNGGMDEWMHTTPGVLTASEHRIGDCIQEMLKELPAWRRQCLEARDSLVQRYDAVPVAWRYFRLFESLLKGRARDDSAISTDPHRHGIQVWGDDRVS